MATLLPALENGILVGIGQSPWHTVQYFKTTGYNGKKDLEASENHRIAWKDVFSKPITGSRTNLRWV